jgi:hypothetical protein
MLILLGGCRPRPEKAKDALVDQLGTLGGPEAAKLRVSKAAKKLADQKRELPGAVKGTGWHIPWYARDPKHPKATPQRLLIADAREGAMISKKDVRTLLLQDVKATMYYANKPSATIEAPHVTTNQRDRIIIATGGVTIHSVLDPNAANPTKAKPADTTVTADKMVWDSNTTQVVCTGNAHLVSKQKGSPTTESFSDTIIYDTETHATRFGSKIP